MKQVGEGTHLPVLASQTSSCPQVRPLGRPHPASHLFERHTVAGGAHSPSPLQFSPTDSGSHLPVASLQRSPKLHPVPVQPGAHLPPSTQIDEGGAQSKSILQPFIAMHLPEVGSQMVSPLQTIGLPIVLQPGTQF